jgi:hypothetical protein
MHLGRLELMRTRTWTELAAAVDELRGEVDQLRRDVADLERVRAEAHHVLAHYGALDVPFATETAAPAQALGAPIVHTPRAAPFIEPPAPAPSARAMMEILDGWVTHFAVDGEILGGPGLLVDDERVRWALDVLGGVQDRAVLELGPMEGAHTKLLLEHGARSVLAIEGFRACFLRCLIVKEVFGLDRARFRYGDFAAYLADYAGPPFDLVLASGVLYHQRNPAQLIYDLGRAGRALFVWTLVADETLPRGPEVILSAGGHRYRGRLHDYEGARNTAKNYMSGPHPTAVWLYPADLERAVTDAGFRIVATATPTTYTAAAVRMFVATR